MKARLSLFFCWLLLAASGFADQYTSSIPVGVTFIANQLDHGSNTLYELFPPGSFPDQSYLTIWHLTSCPGSNTYYYESDFPGDGWATDDTGAITVDPRTVTLAPGDAAAVQNTLGPAHLVFTGTPHVPVLPPCCRAGLTYIIFWAGRQTTLGLMTT